MQQQQNLLEQKVDRLQGLIQTIRSSIHSETTGEKLGVESMFQGFETEEEWKEALKDQNDYLKKEYDVDLTNQTIDVESMNESAREAKAFNDDMVDFLLEGRTAKDPKVFSRVKDHLSFLEQKGHPATPNDFLNQTEFFLEDTFHRQMLEEWQPGYSYYLNKVAANYAAQS